MVSKGVHRAMQSSKVRSIANSNIRYWVGPTARWNHVEDWPGQVDQHSESDQGRRQLQPRGVFGAAVQHLDGL